jgi:hypothetical protein
LEDGSAFLLDPHDDKNFMHAAKFKKLGRGAPKDRICSVLVFGDGYLVVPAFTELTKRHPANMPKMSQMPLNYLTEARTSHGSFYLNRSRQLKIECKNSDIMHKVEHCARPPFVELAAPVSSDDWM